MREILSVDPKEQLELLSKLVSINSVNPDLVPGSPGERKIAEFIANYLEESGLEVKFQRTSRNDRPNVIGILHGSGGGKTLMLNGHTDTVGVKGMRDPFTARLEDEKLYGRGAFDMKGGLSSMLLAAKIIRQSGSKLRGDLLITGVVDEEYASVGTEEIAKDYHADGAIILEASDLKIGVAHKGFAWIDVETFGKAAHGSMPNLGVDAILSMGEFLTRIEALERELSQSKQHPLLGPGSIHASTIQGGRELSTYPDHCLVQLERRTIPGETKAQVTKEIQDIIDDLHSMRGGRFRASSRITLFRDPWEADKDSFVVKALSKAIVAVSAHESGITSDPGWMDSAILQSVGIPCVIFGPGGFGAHGLDEYVNFHEVVGCTKILIQAIRGFCE
jgi:acetylornithine deacetylase